MTAKLKKNINMKYIVYKTTCLAGQKVISSTNLGKIGEA